MSDVGEAIRNQPLFMQARAEAAEAALKEAQDNYQEAVLGREAAEAERDEAKRILAETISEVARLRAKLATFSPSWKETT